VAGRKAVHVRVDRESHITITMHVKSMPKGKEADGCKCKWRHGVGVICKCTHPYRPVHTTPTGMMSYIYMAANLKNAGAHNASITTRNDILPPSRNIRTWRVQTQGITVRGNDFYTPHFTLPTNSPPTHQPHSILSYPSRTLYFGTKFEPSRTLYFGTEGVPRSMSFSLRQGRYTGRS
jgi:hypothetical protein